MKRVFTIMALLSASQMALATGQQHNAPDPSAEAAAASTAIAGAQAASTASSSSESAATSSAQQTQTASSVSHGSSASVIQNYKAVRNAPSIALGSVYPTAGCQGGIGLGGSGVNGSGLLNFSFTKKECETVVLAQNFASIGMPDVSCQLLKTTKAFKRAGLKDIDCTVPPKEAIAQVPVNEQPIDPRYVTREELSERDRRMITTMSSK